MYCIDGVAPFKIDLAPLLVWGFVGLQTTQGALSSEKSKRL